MFYFVGLYNDFGLQLVAYSNFDHALYLARRQRRDHRKLRRPQRFWTVQTKAKFPTSFHSEPRTAAPQQRLQGR